MTDLRYISNYPRVMLTPPPPASDRESVLAFSLAKAGSTLLYNMLHELAPLAGLTYYSIEDALFAADVSPNRRPALIGNVFAQTGYCYGGFRQFPAYPIPILHSTRSIFLVRDPRDMAVSLYFSMMKSHVLPDATGDEGGARADFERSRSQTASVPIDQWVASAAVVQYTRMFEGYLAQGYLWRPNIVTYRYEDVIFHKAAWLADICDWFGWNVDRGALDAIAARFDARPEGENPDQHVRQVTPGNYRKHLSQGTIGHLNALFGEYMRLFGYLD